jgi:hypothetical protein
LNFVVHKAQPTKSTGRTTGGNEGSDGGSPEEGRVQVTNTHYRLARRRRLPERTEKARLVGRPSERLEVKKRRAQRLLKFVLEIIPHYHFAEMAIGRKRPRSFILVRESFGFEEQPYSREVLMGREPHARRSYQMQLIADWRSHGPRTESAFS